MERQPAFYTLKVWLCSAAISPIITGIIQFYLYHGKTDNDFSSAVMLYPIILAFEILLTFFLWVLFWTLTAICNSFIKKDNTFRWATSVIGLTIAAVLCWSFGQETSFSTTDMFTETALANCVCIFAGCWYFNIGRPVTELNTSTTNTNTYEQTPE